MPGESRDSIATGDPMTMYYDERDFPSGFPKPEQLVAGTSRTPNAAQTSAKTYGLHPSTATGSPYASFPNKTTVVSAAYTATQADNGTLFLVDATAGAVQITLPAAPTGFYAVGVQKTDSSGNAVTVAPTSPDTMATTSLATQNERAGVAYDSAGAAWYNFAGSPQAAAVTTAMLADGSVTAAKLAGTALNTPRKSATGAGANIELDAQGAKAGETDTSGGNLVLASGLSTGAGSSYVSLVGQPAGATGTTDTTPTEVLRATGTDVQLLAGLVMSRVASGAADLTLTAADIIGAVTDTTAARAVNLPQVSTVPVGKVYIIPDESGGAATHNITVTAHAGDTIDGAATLAISTNYGVSRLYAVGGTAWKTF